MFIQYKKISTLTSQTHAILHINFRTKQCSPSMHNSPIDPTHAKKKKEENFPYHFTRIFRRMAISAHKPPVEQNIFHSRCGARVYIHIIRVCTIQGTAAAIYLYICLPLDEPEWRVAATILAADYCPLCSNKARALWRE